MAKLSAIVALAIAISAAPAVSARAQVAPEQDGAEEQAQDPRELQRAADEAAQRLVGGSALSPLPIRQVTVFKDGSAFVLHQGRVRPDERGQVVLGGLPSPVLGTFWPFAVGAKLQSATASLQSVTSVRDAQSVAELLRANVGAKVTWLSTEGAGVDSKPVRTEGTILEFPKPAIPGASPEIILLKTEDGVRAAPLASLRDVTFVGTPRTQSSDETKSAVLKLQLDKQGGEVEAGAVYLQRGLRWIPNYRLQLCGGGKATMSLQATLINELSNLEGVAARLAIGVPSFAFRDTLDPIALAPEARPTPDFEAQFGGLGNAGRGRFGENRFSNAIQTQVANGSYALSPQPNVGPTVSEGGANEDFFFFDVASLTLKKGERSVVPIAQGELKYQDIYVAQSPAAPPPAIYQSLNSEQQRQVLAGARAAFMHKLRLTNTGRQPLTTAPTLIERDGQPLAQALMTYTATGGRTDIDLAPAVDITLKRSEDEVKRTPDALTYNGDKFARVDVSGKLTVTSFRNEAVTVEITRQFIGKVDSAGKGQSKGEVRQVGAGDDSLAASSEGAPWWASYTSNSWREVNPVSSVTWTATLPAKSTLELPYSYFYFWR